MYRSVTLFALSLQAVAQKKKDEEASLAPQRTIAVPNSAPLRHRVPQGGLLLVVRIHTITCTSRQIVRALSLLLVDRARVVGQSSSTE